MNTQSDAPAPILGAIPPKGVVPLCVPNLDGNEWAYIKECLDTGWVSSVGSFVDRFEQELARYVGSHYAVATVSGTAALHIALLVAGVEPDDEVLVSTLTFIAPVNAIRYADAWPIFIDAEPTYWQMDPEKVAEFLEQDCHWANGELRNKVSGRRVKAILPVHILGHPCAMESICALAMRYNLTVIEDATESLGAQYKGKMVGNLGEIACFSFNGNKLITTGGGGMIVTDNAAWAKRARYLTTQAKDDPIEYIHHEIGYNYRLTNLQAAMGCAQLEQLDQFIATKRHIAQTYCEQLRNLPAITLPQESPDVCSAQWLFTILVNGIGADHLNSRQLMHELQRRSIQSRPFWRPAHLQKAYQGLGVGTYTVSEELYQCGLSLPCSTNLTDHDLSYVVETIWAIANHV